MTTHLRRVGTFFVAAALGLAACSATTEPASTTIGTTIGTTPIPTSVATTPGGTQVKTVASPYGEALGRGDGLVLYAWQQEENGGPICADDCAEKWPPLLAADLASVQFGPGIDASMFALAGRPDGSQQVTVNGRRLYTMSADAPGEANCQGGDGLYLQTPAGGWNTNTTPAS